MIDINKILKELKQYAKANNLKIKIKIENGVGEYYEIEEKRR